MNRPFTISFLFAAAALTGCVRTAPLERWERDDWRDSVNARAELLSSLRASESRSEAADPFSPLDPNVVTGGLSRAEAVDVALRNNPTLRLQTLAMREAGSQVTQAYAAAWPTLALGGEASRTDPSDGNGNRYAATLNLTQPLWRNGAVSAGIRYAAIYREAAALERQRVRQKIECDASVLYDEVLLDQELVKVYESACGVAERLLETTRRRRDRGTAADYEVLRAEVEVAGANADLIQQRNALRLARIALCNALGISQDSRFELTDPLAEESAPADASAAVDLALRDRPDLRQAHAAVAMARENLRAEKARRSGFDIDLFGKGAYVDKDSDEASDWEDEWTVGLSASFLLCDGFQQAAKVALAETRLEEAFEQLRLTEQTVLADVATATLELEHAQEFYESQKKNLDLAHELLRTVEAGSRAGKNTQIEVLDARDAVTDASGAYYRSLYLRRKALAALRFATGAFGE